MVHQQSPTIVTPLGRRRVGLDPTPPPPAMFLVDGVWIASCPTCGYELVHHVSQQRAEEQAAGRRCPVCDPDAA
jgi:hypothetical protein